MTRRDRKRRPARAETSVEPRRRILVVSEGAVTERQYLQEFKKHCRNPLVSMDFEGAAGVPVTLVNRAKELKRAAEDDASRERDANLGFDEVWCVFDVDEHPHIPDARQMATANGLRLAMSNPCFELWLLLHFRDSPGLQHRHEIQRLLATEMPGVKPKHIEFARLIPGYEEAHRRATRLERERSSKMNDTSEPFTEVVQLIDSIDEVGQRERARKAAEAKKGNVDLGRTKAEEAARAALLQVESEMVEDHAEELELFDELTDDGVSEPDD